MSAFLKSSGRVAAIAFALGLGAAALATPALAFSRGGSRRRRGARRGRIPGMFAELRPRRNFRGRGGWGPGIGAAWSAA